MLIYTTSDLHYHPDDRVVEELANHVIRVGTEEDVLWLLGDYANGPKQMRQCLGLFAKFPGTTLAIPGNHDMWGHPDRYADFADACREFGMHPLTEGQQTIGSVGFAGVMGWYDYSFRDSIGIPTEAYQSKIFPGDGIPGWNDANYIGWNYSDQQVTDWQAGLLERQLEELSSNPHLEHLFVGIHHVPTRALLPYHWCRWMVPKRWRFFNAFLGSERFEEICKAHGKRITHVFCGHIHMEKTVVRSGIPYTSLDSQQLVIINPNTGSITKKRFTQR